MAESQESTWTVESETVVEDATSIRKHKGIIVKMIEWWTPSRVEKLFVGLVTPGLIWTVTFLLVGNAGLPGGEIFALLVILFGGIVTGYIIAFIKFPPLLGMLVVGIMIRNVPGISFGKDLTGKVTSPLRQIALVVILIRAGLGLDPAALKKLSAVVIRLAFFPCLVEATVIAISSHFIMGFPWAWGFMLGFVLAAVSPAVIVHCLLGLRDQGYGVAKGIPTIVIAAASIDDILAISGFGIAFGLAMTHSESLSMTILKGPIEVVCGILFGIFWGTSIGMFISSLEKENKEATVYRVLFTLFGGCLSVFGFTYVGYSGSGALGCLISAFVAALLWRRKGVLSDNDNLTWAFQNLWFVFQPLLFGLIGSEIDFSTMEPKIILEGLLCLAIALSFRILTSFLVVAGAGLTLKERLFIAVAWLPKATVQAAIGSIAYDYARRASPEVADEEAIKRGLEILTIAVLSILLTAPVGAIAIMICGPKLLTKDTSVENTESSDSTVDSYSVSNSVHRARKVHSITPHQTGKGDVTDSIENGKVDPIIKIEAQDIRIQMVTITSSPKMNSVGKKK